MRAMRYSVSPLSRMCCHWSWIACAALNNVLSSSLALGSGGGAVLELSGSYAVGSMLRLGFKLPSTTTEISCTAIVRDRLNAQGVGVEFLHLEPRDRKRISTFVLERVNE